MQNNLLKRKWLAVGIILLLIGTCIIPSTGVFTVLNTKKNDNGTLPIISGSSPEEEWNRTYPFPTMGYTSGNCVQETPDEGYIITGYVGFGYWYNLYLLKVDNQGIELWNRTFGGNGSNSRYNIGFWVEVTNDNGYIITGQRGFGDINAWLIKTDANGIEEWNRTFGDSGDEYGYCVKQTNEGGYIITGRDGAKIWLIKTDSFGNEIWIKTYANRPGCGVSLALTNDGGYIVTGYLVNYKLILLKTDTNGSLEWEKTFGISDHSNYGSSVQQTVEGGYIVGGSTGSYGAGYRDFWLIKTDGNGLEIWNRTFGGSSNDYGNTVLQTVDGGYLLGGERNWPEKFWLVRTNLNGDIVWNHVYIPSQNASCLCLQQTKDNGYIATGEINPFNAPECVIIKIKPDSMNGPPSSSPVDGSSWGIINTSYLFCINITDPDGDALYCKWRWGDGNDTDWYGPYSSGDTIYVSHLWSEKGTYEIQVKIKDEFGHESYWSDPYVFTVYEVKNAFLIGRYLNKTTEGNYSYIKADNLWIILFRPFQNLHYSTGEKITYLPSKSKVFITARLILGIITLVM